MSTIRTRLIGLGASIMILLLLVGTPAILIGTGATPWRADLGQTGGLLTSPDDGTLALVVIGVVAWLAWAVVAVSFTVELFAAMRGIPSPQLPGLSLPQHHVGRLVATAALLFVVAPTLTTSFLPPAASAAVATESPGAASLYNVPAGTASEPVAAAPKATQAQVPATVEYTVRQNDSLWRIADEQLGDGTRYVEIVALNHALLPHGPRFIEAGLVLHLPANAPEVVVSTSVSTQSYVVKPGDTLWDIADAELGDATRFPEIFKASQNTVHPDGAHLTDPDLIVPGWKLTIPHEAAHGAPDGVKPESHDDLSKDSPPQPGPATVPESTAVPTAESSTHSAKEPNTSTADTHDDSNLDQTAPAWLLTGLTGAGTLLAGALFLVLRGSRRTQLRYRRPSQVIAPPPPELAGVEKTAHVYGGPAADRIEDLDRLLRQLAFEVDLTNQSVPHLLTVELADDAVTLHLASPAPLPPGWAGSTTEWTATIVESTPKIDQLAPYPLLATIGQSDDGHLWLANFEELGSVTFTGNIEAAQALGRYVAAELTLDPWAVLVDVDTLGLGDELSELDPMRLHQHPANDTDFLERIANALDARYRTGTEPEGFHALLASAEARLSEPVRRVVRAINDHDNRIGGAMITVGGMPTAGDVAFELTARRLLVPSLDLDLIPAGLSSDEAATSAAIVELTRDATPIPMPANLPTAGGWRGLTDQSGALDYALADARPQGRAGETSLLPEALETYEAVAATTAADVEALAPVISDQSRRLVEDTDPSLDDDLMAWFDPNCTLPRVQVLGPVRVRTLGEAAAVAKRKPHYVELVTFLALRPDGASTAQVAEAFALKKERVRVDVTVVRRWLGTNPRTGESHLPLAAQSRTAAEVGAWTYQLDDTLVDADLFRRLHARGQARGAAGQADYDAALRLVLGKPFDDLRDKGWNWLLDDDSRLDETLECAIVDVAHIVVTDALARHDLDRAQAAVETATNAAPYDEVARLDHVAVLIAQGHQEAAERLLADDICNRSDDHLGPIDLPERTAQIIEHHGRLKSDRSTAK